MKKEKEIPAWEELSPDDRMKYEIAEELGLLEKVRTNGWRSLSAKETGYSTGIFLRMSRSRSMSCWIDSRTWKQ